MSKSCFTCITCFVAFDTSDLHRAHYQSEWHRYNLRRKVAELPPLTESAFTQRVDTHRQDSVKTAESLKPKSYSCTACRKTFNSQNSYDAHTKSKKHLDLVANIDTLPTAVVREKIYTDKTLSTNNNLSFISQDAKEEDIEKLVKEKLATARRLASEECIFCNTKSDCFESNVEHMAKVHGLYIPDVDFLTDLPGLLTYLADKVAVAHCCLYCPASILPFHSMDAVRKHMIDKGHLKIRYDEEGMDELAEFYNYEEVMEDDGDAEYEDVEGEMVYDDGSLILSPDESELILPSGKRIGHRAYKIYYKQYLRVSEDEPIRRTRRGEHQALVSGMSDRQLALGLASESEQKKLLISQRHCHEDRKEWDMKVGIKNNALQEYFRYQLRQ